MDESNESTISRREMIIGTTATIAAITLANVTGTQAAPHTVPLSLAKVSFTVNGQPQNLEMDTRTTLLDLLREQLHLTGTKKGCDHGQCGACTVHVDGARVNACLTLAMATEGSTITTIEGLTDGDPATAPLHPMQAAFIKHDGFQCGYCTPGQIMSAVACIREGHANTPEEVREYMSGNICRCGAYANIVDSIMDVKKGGAKV